MNRLSTAGFVPPSVEKVFFVLAQGRSGQLSTTPRRAQGTVGFWACCPAPPRPAAPPCAGRTQTARGMFVFWTRQVQRSVGPVVNTQERKQAAVSRTCLASKAFTQIKWRWSIAQQPGTKSAFRPTDKPLINRLSNRRCVPPSVYMGCSCFWENVQETCFRRLEGYKGRWSPRRTVLSAFRPAQPRPAAQPCAPTRPARGMSGFWIRQVNKVYTNNSISEHSSAAKHDEGPSNVAPQMTR